VGRHKDENVPLGLREVEEQGQGATMRRAKEKTRGNRAMSLSFCIPPGGRGRRGRRPRDKARHEGIHDDLDGPVDKLVGVHEELLLPSRLLLQDHAATSHLSSSPMK